jgi:hypothetical protein
MPRSGYGGVNRHYFFPEATRLINLHSSRKEGTEMTFLLKILRRAEEAGICATCTWGLVRKGVRNGHKEMMCRLLTPPTPVPFPVSECNEYCDRRAPASTAPVRRIGFVQIQPVVSNEAANE